MVICVFPAKFRLLKIIENKRKKRKRKKLEQQQEEGRQKRIDSMSNRQQHFVSAKPPENLQEWKQRIMLCFSRLKSRSSQKIASEQLENEIEGLSPAKLPIFVVNNNNKINMPFNSFIFKRTLLLKYV